jgi:hypothetical protein
MDESPGEANGPIVGTIELEERDLRAAFIELSWILRARFGIVFILAFSYGSLALMAPEARGQLIQPPFILSVVFAAVLFVSPRLRARKLLEAIAKGGDRRASYRFDDEGVTFRTAGSTMTSAYRSLVEYAEGKTAFLIYGSPGVANIVPKRAFSPEELARVRAWLAANVKPKRTRSASKIIVIWFGAILLFMVVWQLLNNAPKPRGAAPAAEPTPAAR